MRLLKTHSTAPMLASLAFLLASCGSSGETDMSPSVNAPSALIEDEVTSEPAPAKAAETPAQRKARLREKAKTDPDGADAEAIDHMGRNELLATAINSAGYLCARVTDMYPSGGDIIAHCVEYRSGSGRVKYRVNPSAGTVEPL